MWTVLFSVKSPYEITVKVVLRSSAVMFELAGVLCCLSWHVAFFRETAQFMTCLMT